MLLQSRTERYHMAKKLKKDKKRMSPKTKNILVNTFKGIISNQACIDNGKEAPWWLAILFLIFGMIIPLIPNFVSLNNAYGSSFLANGTFGLDANITKASVALKSEGKHLNVSKGLLSYSDTTHNYSDPIYTSTDTRYGEYNFMMYYTNFKGSDLNNFINKLTTTEYVLDSKTVYDKTTDPKGEVSRYIPSFVVLTEDTLVAAIYKSRNTNRAGNTPGGLNWLNTAEGDLLARVNEGLTSTTEAEVANNKADWEKCFNSWRGIFNETFLMQKETNKWNTTLIYLGVYAGLIIFLGLMLFLLTRGKTNPFSQTLNFWHTQKIAYFLSFTPAVLALVVGFIFAGNIFGQMGFIMLISLRAMWASMRQLRPIQ